MRCHLKRTSRATGSLLLVALLLGACASAAPPSAGSSPTQRASGGAPAGPAAASAGASAEGQSAFAALVEAANREGRVVLWANSPEEKDVPRVEQALNARFKTNVRLEVVSMRAGDARTRIAAEAQGGRHEVDVISQMSTDMIPDLVQRGLLARVDWPTLVARELPDVKDSHEAAFAEFRGYYLAFGDRAYSIAYNTRQTRPEELPKRWADLGDPRYRGRVSYDARGFPFNYLVLHPDWGAERTERLVRDIAANGPLLQGGAPQVAAAVGRGEAPIGITTMSTVIENRLKGDPVGVAIMDYIPLDPFVTAVAERAPHPNAARLYAAWAVSEGMQVFGELYQTSRLTQPNNPLEKVIHEQSPNVKLAAAKSEADVRQAGDFLKQTGEILTGVR